MASVAVASATPGTPGSGDGAGRPARGDVAATRAEGSCGVPLGTVEGVPAPSCDAWRISPETERQIEGIDAGIRAARLRGASILSD